MKTLLALLLLCISLFSTTLLTYNTYDREDRVDIMLSFDTPYNGKIFLKKDGNTFSIILNNIFFNKTVTKNINSPILEQMKIVPQDKNIKIILISKKKINIIASKTTDGFGLRLRALPQNSAKKQNFNIASSSKEQNSILDKSIKTDSSYYGDLRYYAVIAILLFLLAVLWLVKKRVGVASSQKWLFGNNSIKSDEVKILYRKPIDTKNSVLLLSYKNRKYLILTGSSNQLLDKFNSEDVPVSDESDDEEFKKIFAQNRQKLDEFLRVGNDNLSTYRDKASQDLDETI